MDGARSVRGSGETHEERQSLLLLATSPLLWVGHFLACYLTAAVWCAKAAGEAGALGWVPAAIGAYTVAALAGIALTGWKGYRRHTFGAPEPPHDADTPEDRHRFLGFATLLLSGLSAVAVVYVALVALFFESCR